MPKKTKQKPKFFYLPAKEEEVMKVLWDNKEPLCASEIAKKIPDRSWPASSIQGLLRSLQDKGAIEIDCITKLGKSYGRLFRPSLSANEYVAMQMDRYYKPEDDGKKSCSFMVSSILGNSGIGKEDIINVLQDIIKEYENDTI